MGEPFDHCPSGWVRQSRECCTKLIHNPMVVNFLIIVKCKFAVDDFDLWLMGRSNARHALYGAVYHVRGVALPATAAKRPCSLLSQSA